jgi:hypothetical protein
VNDLEGAWTVRARLSLGKREHERDVSNIGDADRAQHEHAAHRATTVLDSTCAAVHEIGTHQCKVGDPVHCLSWREHHGAGVVSRERIVGCDRRQLGAKVRERFLEGGYRNVDGTTVSPGRVAELLGALRSREVAAHTFGLVETDQSLEAKASRRVVDLRVARVVWIENYRFAVARGERVQSVRRRGRREPIDTLGFDQLGRSDELCAAFDAYAQQHISVVMWS